MSRRSRRARLPQGEFEAVIESLSHDGRGVTHLEGKAVFIEGALPGEQVSFRYVEKTRHFDAGVVVEVLSASEDRVEPRCPHFSVCGGCSLQHLASDRQIAFKQQAMLEGLEHIGKVTPDEILPPLTARSWGYRRKARLGVRYVRKKGRVLVGFREKRSGFLADLSRCEVLHESVGGELEALQAFLVELDCRERIPQIEVAVSDTHTALVFRHLDPLTAADKERFQAFNAAHEFQIYLQPKGPASIHCLEGISSEALFYAHPDYQVKVEFGPLDFFQVNSELNRQMVPLAMALLEVQPEDRVLDLFCGLGNFTLPLARHAAEVVGVEGDLEMVKRARQNAIDNQIDNTRYFVANLMEALGQESWINERYDKILLDPPRSGAKEVITHFDKLSPSRIVYVSCHPGSLARDAGELVHTHGYRLVKAGVMDMFPHTAHVESIAVFER
ncbi:MAG: 23S rRNA (uracil(1939)-C(5))-methyltransferase RlmD [Thiotrichales bacterium]